jgi:hypothetical protein
MGKPYSTSIAQLWDISYYQKGRSYGEALQHQYSSAVEHKLLSERKELWGSLTAAV